MSFRLADLKKSVRKGKEGLQVAPARMDGAVAQLQKLLNVEGYGVLRVDGSMLVLDARLLREQFPGAGFPPALVRMIASAKGMKESAAAMCEVAQMLAEDSPELRRRRSEAMRDQTWARKVEELSSHVMRFKAERTCKAMRAM